MSPLILDTAPGQLAGYVALADVQYFVQEGRRIIAFTPDGGELLLSGDEEFAELSLRPELLQIADDLLIQRSTLRRLSHGAVDGVCTALLERDRILRVQARYAAAAIDQLLRNIDATHGAALPAWPCGYQEVTKSAYTLTAEAQAILAQRRVADMIRRT